MLLNSIFWNVNFTLLCIRNTLKNAVCCMTRKVKFSFRGGGGGWRTRPPLSEFSGSAPDQVLKLATELTASFNSVEKSDCYNEFFSGHDVMNHNVHNTLVSNDHNMKREQQPVRKEFNESFWWKVLLPVSLYSHCKSFFYIFVLITHLTYTMLPAIFNEPIVMNWHRSFFCSVKDN